MKSALKNLLIISALIPATVLLGLTYFFLPGFIMKITFSVEEVLILISMIFGIFGFLGLTLSLIPKFEKEYQMKVILLTLGVIGALVFMTITGGEKAWKWMLKIEELNEWIIWAWPILVSLILIFINGRKICRRD